MVFHAFHGCLERERKEGNTFVVDFYAETSTYERGFVKNGLCYCFWQGRFDISALRHFGTSTSSVTEATEATEATTVAKQLE